MIKRHKPIDQIHESAYLSNLEILNTILNNLEYPEELGILHYDAKSASIYSVLLNKNKKEIKQNFDRYSDMGCLAFKLVEAIGQKTFKAKIHGKLLELNVAETNRDIFVSDWLKYLQYSIITGNQNNIDYLCSIPIETFEKSVSFNNLDTLVMVSFMLINETLHNPEKYVIEGVVEELDLRLSHIDTYKNDYVDPIVVPIIKIYRNHFADNADLVIESIECALDKHLEYYTTKDKEDDPEGWVSVPILSSLIQLDINHDFKTEYMPQILRDLSK